MHFFRVIREISHGKDAQMISRDLEWKFHEK